jgi:hypothetical protein
MRLRHNESGKLVQVGDVATLYNGGLFQESVRAVGWVDPCDAWPNGLVLLLVAGRQMPVPYDVAMTSMRFK